MFKQMVIMDKENKNIIFSRVSTTDTIEDIEEHITEELALSLDQVSYMVADKISVEW